MEQGRSQMDLVEGYYRKAIEQFITKLELEMSKHLDSLQHEVEAEKQRVFSHTNSSIQTLTQIHRMLNETAFDVYKLVLNWNGEKYLSKITDISMSKPGQSLGFEQLKKLCFPNISTVGIKEDGARLW